MAILIRNCQVWDGTGTVPFTAEVLVDGGRIRQLQRGSGTPRAPEGVEVIDALGMTLMPGLVEGHAHLSFCGATKNTDLGDIPPEEHVIETLHNARTLLDAGFTSAYSAASAKLRLDVVVRNEVNSGRSPGPRIRAASPEITVTGGLGDENKQHLMRDSFAIVADGPQDDRPRGAHLHPRRRRQHQAQHLRRRLRARQGRHDGDARRRGAHAPARWRTATAAAYRRTRAPARRSGAR